MPKKAKPDARLSEMRAEFLLQAEELWDAHQEEFMGVLEESEARKVKLSYGVMLDFSESKASLETTMGFSQVVKDKRQKFFDDPNQLGLPMEERPPGDAPGEDGERTAEQELAERETGKGTKKKAKKKKK